MSTVFAGSSDCRVGSGAQPTWSKARANFSAFSNTQTNFTFAIYNVYSGGRGSNNFFNVRSYFGFDLSGLSGTVSSATISIYARSTGTAADQEATMYLKEATSVPTNSSGFGNVFSSGTTFGTALGNVVVGTSLAYNDVTVSSGGITAINNQIGSGTFAVGAVGHYDNANTAPSLSGNFVRMQIYYSEDSSGATSTSNDPKLTLTFAASGYTHTVMGVAAGSIGKVKGVATANIGKVIGVD